MEVVAVAGKFVVTLVLFGVGLVLMRRAALVLAGLLGPAGRLIAPSEVTTRLSCAGLALVFVGAVVLVYVVIVLLLRWV